MKAGLERAREGPASTAPGRTEKSSMLYVWIMLGSALGGGARYWISSFIASHFGETFPWGTILVNISGSLAIGFFATLTGPDGVLLVSTTARQFVMIGLCGGYTTFSSFSIQTLNLVRDGDWFRAGANVAVSLVLCLFAVWLGHVAASALNQLEGGGWQPRLRFPPERAPQTATPQRETDLPPALPAHNEGVPQKPQERTGAGREGQNPAPDFAPAGVKVPVPPPRPRDLKRGQGDEHTPSSPELYLPVKPASKPKLPPPSHR
jgi:CrcB protein